MVTYMKIKRVIVSLFFCTMAVVFTASCSCAGNNESNNTVTTAESETVDSEKDTVSGESAEDKLDSDATEAKTASLVSDNSSSKSSASSGAESNSTKSSKASKLSSKTSDKTSSKTQSKNSSQTTSDTTSEGIPKDNVEIDFGDLE